MKSFIKHFRDEFVHHIEKKCLAKRHSRAEVGPRRRAWHEPHVVRNMAEAA